MMKISPQTIPSPIAAPERRIGSRVPTSLAIVASVALLGACSQDTDPNSIAPSTQPPTTLEAESQANSVVDLDTGTPLNPTVGVDHTPGIEGEEDLEVVRPTMKIAEIVKPFMPTQIPESRAVTNTPQIVGAEQFIRGEGEKAAKQIWDIAAFEGNDKQVPLVIAGGTFNQVTDGKTGEIVTRDNLLAFNPITGELSESFHPEFDGSVYTLDVATFDGSRYVYAGGDFDRVNGQNASKVVRINADTGEVDPSFNVDFKGGKVNDIKILPAYTIFAGTFKTVNGKSIENLVAIDHEGKIVDAFNIVISGDLEGREQENGKKRMCATSITDIATDSIDMTEDGTPKTIVLAGCFEEVNGQKQYLAFMLVLDPNNTSGVPRYIMTEWKVPGADSKCLSGNPINSVSVAGGKVAIGTTGGKPENTGAICDSVLMINSEGKLIWQTLFGTGIDGDSVTKVQQTPAGIVVLGHFEGATSPEGYSNVSGLTMLDPETGVPIENFKAISGEQIGGRAVLPTKHGLYIGTDSTIQDAEGSKRGGLAMLPYRNT